MGLLELNYLERRFAANRSQPSIAKLPRRNDWGGCQWIFPVILAGGKQIKLMGRNGNSALVCGYDAADFSRATLSTAAVFPALDADDFFVEVAAGYFSVYAVTNKGYVYAGGFNNFGQLGQGDTNNRDHLRRIEYFVSTNPKNISSIRVAYDNKWQQLCVFFLTSAGEVFACGYGLEGQLGNGVNANQSLPVRCGTLTGITGLSVSASLASVYAWNAAGQLWTWGRNVEGQLGLGDSANRSSPVLSTLTGIRKVVSAGGGRASDAVFWGVALALKTDGTVYSVGSGAIGALGVGDVNPRTTWTLVAGGLNNVADVMLGGALYTTSFALRNDGRVWAWGFNDRGTCATGDFTQRNAPVECTLPSGMQGKVSKVVAYGGGLYNAVFFLTSDNRLAAAGSNAWGNHGASWYGFSGNNGAQEIAVPSGLKIQDIAAADANPFDSGLASWILDSNGELYAAGYNGHGLVGTDHAYRGANGYFRPCMF